MAEKDIRELQYSSADYPALLRKISTPPQSLWVRGMGLHPDAFNIAGIGSQTTEEKALAKLTTFLEDVIRVFPQYYNQPLVLISGLAKGTDARVHELALAHDVPTTGVLFTPINRMWPPENIDLARAILEKNTVGNSIVSEHAPVADDVVLEKDSEAPKERNRITTGLTEAVIAGMVLQTRSGTRNAVRQARQAERPVFLVEGTISDSVKSLLIGSYGAVAVTTATQMFTLLKEIKK